VQPNVTILPFTLDYLTPVAEFLNMGWRTTYAGILDAHFLDGLTTQTREDILRQKLARGMSGLMAHDKDGALIGFTLLGPTHLEVLGQAGEVNMLYVRPDIIGTGLGHLLMTQAEATLIADGYTAIGLDVFTPNTRAIKFYERHGYTKVGTKFDNIEGKIYELDIMLKQVVDASVA